MPRPVAEFRTLVAQLRPLDEVLRVFGVVDRDGSADLDASELLVALHMLGLDATSSQSKRLLAKFDLDKSLRLELDEFRTLVAELRRFQAGEFDDVYQAFSKFDANQSGELDARELGLALCVLGLPVESITSPRRARPALSNSPYTPCRARRAERVLMQVHARAARRDEPGAGRARQVRRGPLGPHGDLRVPPHGDETPPAHPTTALTKAASPRSPPTPSHGLLNHTKRGLWPQKKRSRRAFLRSAALSSVLSAVLSARMQVEELRRFHAGQRDEVRPSCSPTISYDLLRSPTISHDLP